MAHGPSNYVRDLLVPQICPALSLSSRGLHFSLPRMFLSLLLVTPNLVQIKRHFLLEAWGPCISLQHHNCSGNLYRRVGFPGLAQGGEAVPG